MKLCNVLHLDSGIWAFFYTLLSISSLLILPCSAVLVNITVDDTFGSKDGTVTPNYLPANSTWHAGSPTEQCDVCAIKPSELDATQIHDQSWHHGSYLPGIPIYVQVTFPGTAVYVYNVVPNTLPGANTFVNISFALDGSPVGQFLRVPDATSSEILYSHLVYANASLSGDAPHTLVMSATGGEESLIFFDYLLYTTEVEETPLASASATSGATVSPTASTTPLSSSHRSVQTGAIVGGIIAGVALLATIAAAVFCLRRRRSHRSHTSSGPSNSVPIFDSEDQETPLMTSPPIHAGPLTMREISHTATLSSSGPGSPRYAYYTTAAASPPPPTRSVSSGAFESKREAELERTIEQLRRQMRSMQPSPGHDRDTGSEALDAKTGGPEQAGALQAMQAEIDALRGLLGAMVDTGDGEETLPRYEDCEARHGQGG